MADGSTPRSPARPRQPQGSDGRGAQLRKLSEAVDALVSGTALDAPCTLTTVAAPLLGCAGAGVMLGVDTGHLRAVAASDARTTRLESLQLELGEGPALAALDGGRMAQVEVGDPACVAPTFMMRAAAVGVARVCALPLRCDGALVGALDLYHDVTGTMTRSQQAIADTLASVSAKVIVSADRLRRSNDMFAAAREQVTQLQRALDSRVLIEQAKGALAARLGIGPAAAFDRLRRHARNRGAPLREVARQVVAGEVLPEDMAS